MLKKIEDYQLEELQNDLIYINIYDLSLKYAYEMNIYWKELFFDIIQEFDGKPLFIKSKDYPTLFSFYKKYWKKIIKDYELNIDIRDYIELCDYIPYKEWSDNPDNGIAYFKNEIYLVAKDINGEI